MQTIFRQQWADNFSMGDVIELLEQCTHTHLVYLGPEEWEPNYRHSEESASFHHHWSGHNQDFLTRKNNRLTLVNGAANMRDQGWYPDIATLPGCKVVHWPAFWLETCSYFANRLDLQNHTSQFEYDMVCMMHRPHPHRGLLMTELMKRNLHQTDLVTWHGQYADSGTASDPYNIDPIWLQGNHYITDNKVVSFSDDEIVLYDRAFCDLVAESTVDVIFFTEKTFRPIILGKVFLIYGGVGINQKLADLGFQLFTEVFDYSFDQEQDHEKRANMVAEQIAQLRQHDTSKLFQMVAHKVSHNQGWAMAMQIAKPTKPKIINDLADADALGTYNEIINYHRDCTNVRELLTYPDIRS